MAERSLLVVGGGKMGEALVAGLLRAGWSDPAAIGVVETDPDRRADLSGRYPGVRVMDDRLDDPARRAGPTQGGVVAVKPADVPAACGILRAAGAGRVLSIAAGVPLAALESWLDPDSDGVGSPAVVRGMPNTAALVGCGAAAVAAGRAAGPDDLAWACSVLEAVGTVLVVPEAALDAVTGLSGSGPAYVFLLVEALVDAGVHVGLTRSQSQQLATQTVLGSARLLIESGQEPATLRAGVTSPGGTTAAGLRVLEAAALRSAVLEAVVAATERSRELGRSR